MKGLLLLSSCLLLNLFCIPSECFGQLTVLVVDCQDSEPLIGVQVYNESKGFADVTDGLGQVKIPDLGKGIDITFSYLGYQKSTVNLSTLAASPTVGLTAGLQLDLVEVVGRTNSKASDILNQVERIKSEQITRSQSQNSAEALEKNAGVYIQRSQLGGGSPVVRGFEANKVLLVVDGIRMNNAIYRSGHLQNAITVDAATLSNLEVIYGPGSLIYGSDALGGVIHFRSKSPRYKYNQDQSTLTGSAYVRGSTLGNYGLHADVGLSFDKIASLTSVSFSSFSDLRSGSKRSSRFPDFGKRSVYVERVMGRDSLIANDDPDVQVGTGYDQIDLLQKVKIRASNRLDFEVNLQYSTTSDVPRYDALIEPDGDGLTWAEWYYGPQQRVLAALRTNYNLQSSFADRMIVINSFQRIDEDRINRRFNQNIRQHQEEDLDVYSNTIDFIKDFTKLDLGLKYGAEFTYNNLSSTAYATDVDSRDRLGQILTRYPSGGASTQAIGIYTYLNKKLGKSSQLIGGLRYNTSSQTVKYLSSDPITWPEDFYTGVSNSTGALTWALGINQDLGSWKLQFMSGSSFRSPNVDDLAKIRVKGGEVQVPNLSLDPEQAINFELNVNKTIKSKSLVGVSAFYTSIKDIIVRDHLALPDGSTEIIDGGDTLTTIGNINAERGEVYGISTNVKAQLNKRWSIDGAFTLTKGTSIDAQGAESPLAHIPPSYGRFGLNFVEGKLDASIIYRFNSLKSIDDYGGNTDNPELATSEGALGWYNINFYLQYTLNDSLKLSSAFENILDRHYRPFASGVSGPGRNLSLTLSSKF